jgi:hypothetical protein
MATYQKFHQFAEDCLKGVHNFTDDTTCTVTVALCAAANAPVAGNSALADLTQIAYTNLSTRVVTGISAEQSSGTASLAASDLTITASGGAAATFRYVVFYNDDSTGDKLMGWGDVGSDVTLGDGDSFLIDIPTNLFTLA